MRFDQHVLGREVDLIASTGLDLNYLAEYIAFLIVILLNFPVALFNSSLGTSF